MTDRQETIEQISFLARSTTRVAMLERLWRTGPTTRSAFRDHVEASRSTVTRSLAAMEERNWIEQRGQTYRLTPIGEVLAREFLETVDSLAAARSLSPFLEWFPYAEVELDVEHLRDAEVVVTDPSDPYAPGRKQTEFLEAASTFWGLFPSIDIEGTRFVHDRIVEGDLEAELIVTTGVEETITAGEYASLFREQLATGQLTVYVSDGDLPFYLGIGDGAVQIGVEDDDGFPRALLETDADQVTEWAESVYREHRSAAREKPVSEF